VPSLIADDDGDKIIIVPEGGGRALDLDNNRFRPPARALQHSDDGAHRRPSTTISVDGTAVKLTAADRSTLAKEFGSLVRPVLERLAEDPAFLSMDVAGQRRRVSALLRSVRKAQTDSVRATIAERRAAAK